MEGGQVGVSVQVGLQVGDRLAVPGRGDGQLVVHAGHELVGGEGQGVAVDLGGGRRGR